MALAVGRLVAARAGRRRGTLQGVVDLVGPGVLPASSVVATALFWSGIVSNPATWQAAQSLVARGYVGLWKLCSWLLTDSAGSAPNTGIAVVLAPGQFFSSDSSFAQA